jgi:DNA-binding NarL/FixJ family response regulator
MRVLFASTKQLLIEAMAALLSEFSDADVGGTIDSLNELPTDLYLGPGDVIILTEPAFDCSTICALQKLASVWKDIAVVLVTCKDEHDSPVSLFQNSVKSILTKECQVGDLYMAITRASLGRPYLTQKIAQAVAADYLSSKREIKLSPRETEVLGFIARGRTTTEIATRLSLSAKTVSAYKSNIKTRLNLRSTSQMVQYAIEHDIFMR